MGGAATDVQCTSSTAQGSNTRHPSPVRGIPTDNGPLERRLAQPHSTCLDLFLKRCYRVGLHNCPCWLCLHFGLLAKHHSHTSLCGWLCAGFDSANARDGEYP